MQVQNTQFLKNLQRFRLVTFDVTDTLLRFRKAPSLQYAQTAAAFGLKNIDHDVLQKCFRSEFRNMDTKHPNFGRNTPSMNWQHWWMQLVQNIFRCVVPEAPPDKLRLIAETLLKQYRTSECWTRIPGSCELVQSARDAGKLVAVVSNFDGSLPQVLREMDLLHQFDFVITSYESKVQKPDARIFELARNICQVAPEEALHIGDIYEIDYCGARNAGWSSLLVSKGTNQTTHDTHAHPSMEEMLKALNSIDIEW